MESALLIALATALALVAALAVALARKQRRLTAAEDAVVGLARSWSEDGTSRGRLCAAARVVADAQVAFLAEPTRRGDAVVVTATADASELAGARLPLDADASLLARTLLSGEPQHVARQEDFAPRSRELMQRLGVHSASLRPVFHGGHAAGVLAIGWRRSGERLDPAQEELVSALAGEAARAIERDAHVALLNRQARTDELTALPNRRAWDEALEREVSRAERSGEPLCVALLDLDHFKAFNDRHGHQAGDAHLRRTAAAWRRELRTVDVLARYGGEEFGIVLPDCDLDRACDVIDRVRGATPGGETASAGVVAWDGAEDAQTLVARADAALYRAKHAGRSVTVPA